MIPLAVLKVSLLILLSWFSLSKTHGHDQHCTNLTWHKNVNTDYVIAGIFPVHYYSSNKKQFVFNPAGLTWTQAFLFAIEEINNSTSLLPGINLGYALYDSCNAYLGLEAALDIIQEPNVMPVPSKIKNKSVFQYAAECYCNKTKPPMIAVVGDAASSSSTRIASVLGARSVVMPQISYSSTSTALSNKKNYPSFLRTIPPDNFQALFIIDILKQFNWKYVSFIASDDAYGRLGVENLLPLLEKENLCVALSDVFDVTDNDKGKMKIKSIVNKLVNDKRSMVTVLWCQYPQAEHFLKEAERQNYYDRVWIATETWGSNNLVTRIHPRVVSGMLGIIPAAVKYTPFETHLQTLTPNNSVYNPWLDDFWGSEGCVRLSNGKYRCNTVVTPGASSLPRNKYINVMDAVYAAAHSLHEILFNKTTMHKSRVTGEQLLREIQKINFTGKANLHVNFNKNGDPGVASYSFTNLHQNVNGNLEFFTVGQWDSVSRKLEILPGSKLVFPNQSSIPPKSICSEVCDPGFYALVFTSKPCCWTCVVCPHNQVQPNYGKLKCASCKKGTVPNNNKTACITPNLANLSSSNFWGVLVIVLTVTAIIMVLFVMIVIGYRWETPLVKALNRELSCIQLSSILMIFLMPMLHFMEPSMSSCVARPFYFIIFYTISVSVTFTKTDRLLRIFKASGSGRLAKNSRVLNNRLQILTVVVLTLIACIVCVTFFFVFRPKLTEEIDRSNGKIIVTYSCGKDYKVLFLALLSYIFGISLTCSIFAFRARKLPENYNEARYTSFAMFSFCLAWLCFLPLYFSLKLENERELTILLVSFISTSAMFVIIYGPKMFVIVFRPQENTMERFRAKLKTVRSVNRSRSGSSPSQNAQRHRESSAASKKRDSRVQSRNPAFETSQDQKTQDHDDFAT